MNTPAHAILNLWALGRRERPETVLPIVIGSVVADLPIVLFYAWAKLVQGLPEDGIWSQAYFAWPGKWIIDLLHSLPVTCAALLLAWLLGRSRLTALFASMLLHVPGDFFLHHDDAHRLFLRCLQLTLSSIHSSPVVGRCVSPVTACGGRRNAGWLQVQYRSW